MRDRTLRAGVLTTVLALALAVTGCSTNKTPAPASTTAGVTGTITVLAASSLTGTFNQIGKDFQAANPGSNVVFSYGGSSTLALQITQGAPADVFASASASTMKTVTDAGSADGTPVVFVRNQLVIAVAKGNPKHITGLADLAKPGVTVALCDPSQPCGAAAKTAIAAASVTITPVTLEQDVKSALSKVTLGEVDAALVYRTDAAAEPKVDAVEFAESAKAINTYPIVVLKGAPNKPGAQAFVAYVLSDAGMKVLTDAGFQRPTS
jgi:molybdate transport system substrate-binding protein